MGIAISIRRALLAGAGLSLLPALLAAQTPQGQPADPEVERGAALFRIHCASCHGKEAKGDGPVASALMTKPADLTTLARRAGGKFPRAEARAVIDGRTDIRAHGVREMPVWGLSFAEPGRDAQRADETDAEIKALVRYLETLQRP